VHSERFGARGGRCLVVQTSAEWIADVGARAVSLEPVSLARVVAEVDIHPSHLARTFSQFHGCTVGDFVRRLKLDRARELLRDPARTLTGVALVTGFADQSHFTRALKERYGLTTGAYRAAFARSTKTGGSQENFKTEAPTRARLEPLSIKNPRSHGHS
jgi:AraC-like DNA-binding protein